MQNSNLYGLDFDGFKMILENLIKVVRIETKKNFEKQKFEEVKNKEENFDEEEENNYFSLKANEELSPLINLGITADKDVNFNKNWGCNLIELQKILEKCLKQFNLPIFEIDEFKLFKELFEVLKKKDPENMKKIIDSLTEQDKKELKEILSTCYVVTDQTPNQIRRILKVKYQ